MPDKMSQEKIALLRAYGAEVVITPDGRRRPESPGATTASPTGSPRRSPAPSSPTSTSIPRTRRRTTRRPAPRSGSRPTDGSTSSSPAWAPAARSPASGATSRSRTPSVDDRRRRPRGIPLLRRRAAAVPDRGHRRGLLAGRRSIRRSSTATCVCPTATRSAPRARSRGRRASSSAARPGRAVLRRARGRARARRDDDDRRACCPTPDGTTCRSCTRDSWMLQYGLLDRPESIAVEEVLAAKGGELPPLVTVRRARQGAAGRRPCCRSTRSRRRPSSARTATEVSAVRRVDPRARAARPDLPRPGRAAGRRRRGHGAADPHGGVRRPGRVRVRASSSSTRRPRDARRARCWACSPAATCWTSSRTGGRRRRVTVRALGIDVGGGRKGLDLVVMDERPSSPRCGRASRSSEFGALIDESAPRRRRDRLPAGVGARRDVPAAPNGSSPRSASARSTPRRPPARQRRSSTG